MSENYLNYEIDVTSDVIENEIEVSPLFGPKGEKGDKGEQGLQGEKGEHGIQGFSPRIAVSTDTPTEYVLEITNENETFLTPNLKGQDGLGTGDMKISVYDSDGDGVVNDSALFAGQPSSFYAKTADLDNYLSVDVSYAARLARNENYLQLYDANNVALGAAVELPVSIVATYHNGASWYRKWSDGFIEQGGYVAGGDSLDGASLQFILPFTSTNYVFNATISTRTTAATFVRTNAHSLNSVNVVTGYIAADGTTTYYIYGCYFYACGW